jgi:hypothetical protein
MAMDTGRRGGRVCGARRRADALQVASRRAEHLGLGGHIRHVLHPAARGSIFSRRRQRPFDPSNQESREYAEARTADYVAIGATADLRLGRRRNQKRRGAPFLVRSGQQDTEAPPSETQLVREMLMASGFDSDDSRMPYSLLSAATHGRFNYAGLSMHTPVGPSENGVTMSALHTPLDVTARVTVLSAITTRTYFRALARYMNIPEGVAREYLQEPIFAWCAIAGVQVPEWLGCTGSFGPVT